MKRKRKLLLTVVSLIFSLCIMTFGVWAAASPNITISGSVVFTTSASQVRVTGKIIDGYDQNNNPIPYVSGQTYHYFDYTDQEKTTLENWSLNDGQTIYFKESGNGVTDIKLQFEFVNNSPFYTVAKFENVGSNQNITVDYEENVVMDLRGEELATKIATITYSIVDDSKPSTLDISFTVSFDKYLPENTDFLSLQQNPENYTPLTVDEINLYQTQYEQQRNLNKNLLQETTPDENQATNNTTNSEVENQNITYQNENLLQSENNLGENNNTLLSEKDNALQDNTLTNENKNSARTENQNQTTFEDDKLNAEQNQTVLENQNQTINNNQASTENQTQTINNNQSSTENQTQTKIKDIQTTQQVKNLSNVEQQTVIENQTQQIKNQNAQQTSNQTRKPLVDKNQFVKNINDIKQRIAENDNRPTENAQQSKNINKIINNTQQLTQNTHKLTEDKNQTIDLKKIMQNNAYNQN